MLLDYVTGEEAQIATADHIERGLFRHLLDLGEKLLLLFFVIRARNCSREPWQMKNDQELPYHGEKKRTYFSILGKLPFWRPYFYEIGAEGQRVSVECVWETCIHCGQTLMPNEAMCGT